MKKISFILFLLLFGTFYLQAQSTQQTITPYSARVATVNQATPSATSQPAAQPAVVPAVQVDNPTIINNQTTAVSNQPAAQQKAVPAINSANRPQFISTQSRAISNQRDLQPAAVPANGLTNVNAKTNAAPVKTTNKASGTITNKEPNSAGAVIIQDK